MKKLKTLLISFILGIMVCRVPTQAAEQKDIDYKTYYEVESVTILENKDKDDNIYVMDNNDVELFTSKPVDETVYTTVYLNLREVPTTNSTPVTVLKPNSEIKRIGDSKCGWDIIQIDETNYFVWDEYLTKEKPDAEIIIVNKIESNTSETYNGSGFTYVGISSPAKEEIARRESGGDYNAVNPTGKYIGRYQLDKSYLNGDYSPENQERVADQYVLNRYGSWEVALEFWNANGWY